MGKERGNKIFATDIGCLVLFAPFFGKIQRFIYHSSIANGPMTYRASRFGVVNFPFGHNLFARKPHRYQPEKRKKQNENPGK